jgi:hypothetical protein
MTQTAPTALAALCPASFKTCFIEWVQSLHEILQGVIAWVKIYEVSIYMNL